MKFTEYLKKEGYVRYRGTVDKSVYEYFGCKCAHRAVWYHKKDSYQCAGCKEQCETPGPEGFQPFLMME
ncbi:DNA-binding protein [Salidesulfovibrio onnuriiensis]|uniref:DNA-binding protein n=1 Tax=Salidesulfovibrio onnuriiensis TaxID=2583823 RepID=UPI0011C821C0|nr:DNA-binding protein [Salidesulfovibrio onnuriiensis]